MAVLQLPSHHVHSLLQIVASQAAGLWRLWSMAWGAKCKSHRSSEIVSSAGLLQDGLRM